MWHTIIYSILHMFVDAICAFAMYGWFVTGPRGYINILIYNFCAFAVQMPLGAWLDILCARRDSLSGELEKNSKISADMPFLFAAFGIVITLLGAFVSPVVLGLGNALFHVGGGVDVICEDRQNEKHGQNLGIFVAPGALGLYLGGLAAGGINLKNVFANRVYGVVICAVWMVILLFVLVFRKKRGSAEADFRETTDGAGRNAAGRAYDIHRKNGIVLVCCLLVVILRSHVGMVVEMPWKVDVVAGVMGTVAVVVGKMAGGFLAARFDMRKVICFSLAAAAGCYLFSDFAVTGWLALFLFNMTMPITLYLLICKYEKQSGFSFGLLTFGIFLGTLPTYFANLFGISMVVSGAVIGCVGSLVSLVFLMFAIGKKERVK